MTEQYETPSDGDNGERDAAAHAGEPGQPEASVPLAIESVSVRRAPKVWTFVLLGVIVGLIAALVLAPPFGWSDSAPSFDTGLRYSGAQAFGFLALGLGAAGAGLGGLVAVALDRRSRRHTHTASVEVERHDRE
ncbi:MAG TPA: hypothetical protein VFU07_06605 [Candidatus Lumbricidophila sp.]|nr:hypothetical protein [Candidatus Lumbricidophila sp.]